MPKPVRTRLLLSVLSILSGAAAASAAVQPAGGEGRDLPPALAPFEFLIGRWKGQGVPRDNPAQRFRGWTETHTWAWVFRGGKPVAMSVALQGGKLFSKGTLRYEPASKQYLLDATKSGDSSQPVPFKGTLDASGKLLILQRVEKGTTERLTLRANSNYVRYTMLLDRKEPGAALFQPLDRDRPDQGRRVVRGRLFGRRAPQVHHHRWRRHTHGAAIKAKSYPICCTGCRDEFIENPEKYLKKLALKTSAGGASKSGPAQQLANQPFRGCLLRRHRSSGSEGRVEGGEADETGTDSSPAARETAEPRRRPRRSRMRRPRRPTSWSPRPRRLCGSRRISKRPARPRRP